MSAAVALAVVVAAVASTALTWRFYRRAKTLAALIESIERRETALLDAARVFAAASRDSSAAVLRALDATLRFFEPAIDAVLVYELVGEELSCIYAAGIRAEHFGGTRTRIDHPSVLPARAVAARCRVMLDARGQAAIPTDRYALAVPMEDGRGVRAVVYASTVLHCGLAAADVLVRTIDQASSPFALALEREADRMSATFDGLTGLYAPRAFRQILKHELARARGSGRSTISLWFIDTDNFKRVNDTLGHAAGDAVLQRMASLLRSHTVPHVDVPARNGGDEFCAVLHNVPRSVAIERAKKFCDAVREFDFGVDVRITASVGVAAYPFDAASAEELLELADGAMYHSKRSGRDRVSFCLDGEFRVYG